MSLVRPPSSALLSQSSSSTNQIERSLKLDSQAQKRAAKKFKKSLKILQESSELVSAEKYQQRTKEIAAALKERLNGRPLVLLKVLEGGSYFANLLASALEELGVAYEMASVSTSSYRDGITGSKTVELQEVDQNKTPFENRMILLVDDILDTRNSYRTIREWLMTKNILDFMFAVGVYKPNKMDKKLLEDKSVNTAELTPDYSVEETTKDDKGFLGGCGLDFLGFHRNLNRVMTIPGERFLELANAPETPSPKL